MIIRNLDNKQQVETGSAALYAVGNILDVLEKTADYFNISKIAKEASTNSSTARYYLEAMKKVGIISLQYLDRGYMSAVILTRNYEIEQPYKPKFNLSKSQNNSLFNLYVEFGMPYTDDDSDSLEDTLKGFREFVENHGANVDTVTQQLEELEHVKDVLVNDRVYESYKEAFHLVDGKYIKVDDYLDEIEGRYPASAMHIHQVKNVYDEILLARYERERAIAAIPLSYSVMEIAEQESPALTEEEEATISLLSQAGVIYKPRPTKQTTFRKVFYNV